MTIEFITDENGNKASVSYWGSEKAARASLKTLNNCNYCLNCRDCSNGNYCDNCSDCNNCRDCFNCRNCNNCHNCNNCNNCHNCLNCRNCCNCNNCNNCSELKIKGLSRSDGHTFYFDNKNHLRAGCRDFVTIEDARKHWSTRHKGTDLALETEAILDYMEKIWPK